MNELFQSEFCARLCWTLAHSLWQVGAMAIVASVFAFAIRRRSAAIRYNVYLAGLLVSLSAFPATFVLLGPEREEIAAVVSEPIPVPPGIAQPTAAAPLPETPATMPELPAAVTPQQPASRASDLTPEPLLGRYVPWIAIAYLFGVCAMACRLGLGMWSASRLSRRAALAAVPLQTRLAQLAGQWKLRIVPRLVVSAEVVVPKVVGILRPVILLPLSATTGLAPDQIDMILAHELAHVRRHDLWVNLLQRIAETLLFFNPAIWYLSRRLTSLREDASDELVCSGAPSQATRYAAALVRVAELSRPLASADIAAIAATGRSPSELRRRVARLVGEPLREPVRLTPVGLVVLTTVTGAVLLGPAVWKLAAEPAKPQAEKVDSYTDDDSHELALQVVGPDGKPVPEVAIRIQSAPALKAEQIRDGTFVRGDKRRPTVKTNADGRATLLFAKQPSLLIMSTTHPGFGPYYARWSSEGGPQEIPSEFTFELEGAYSIGGVVVDEQGNPIEGVEVNPSIPMKLRPGDNQAIGSGAQVKTYAAGRWRFESVPNSKDEVFVEISHPKYKPLRRPLVREEFALAEGETPSKQIVLEQGLIVTGTVSDDAGKPIAGALVRTKFLNDIREAKTDENGYYEIVGCEPAMARVVVSAKGKALDMQEVRVSDDMDPVDFQMQPGGKVRLRVVDEKGKPIPKTRIFFQRWRDQRIDYFEFDHVNQYADENGVWEWNEAPLDGFQADICPPGGMQLSYHPLIARDEEYVISPPQALVVSGTVIDAETKQPVKSFRVIPGTRESSTLWARGDIVEAADGKYQIRRTRGSAAGHLIRIEADGYQATVSRSIKNDEGNVTLNFELQRGKNVAAEVLMPDGEPAVGAKVALGVAKSQISVENGEIDDGSTYAAKLDTDQEGRFSFPPQDTAYQLVITHPAGYAHIKGTPDNPAEEIQLIPWARVEGTFRVGREPQPNVSLRLYSEQIRSYGEGVASIFTDHQATTGPGGRFVFPRVFPGDGWVGRDILLMVDDGAQEVTSSARTKGHFPAGRTTKMELGGDGQPVIGKLAPPDDFEEKVFWNFALIHVRADPPPPIHPKMPVEVQALPENRQTWWFDFLKTDEGKAAMPTYQAYAALRDSQPFFSATVAPDGTFRIDDMPDGDYSLSVRFSKFGPGKIQNLRFMVPPTGSEPFDLGVIKLER